MYLDIITPQKSIFSGEVVLIKLPGAEGSFELLNNHAPIVAVLKEGEVKIKDKESHFTYFPLKGGIVECSKNKVIILAE